MSHVPVRGIRTLVAVVGAAGLMSACDADLTDLGALGDVTELSIHNAAITSKSDPACDIFAFDGRISQGGSSFRAHMIRHLQEHVITTLFIIPESGSGIEVRQPVSIHLVSRGVSHPVEVDDTSRISIPDANCDPDVRRSFRFEGTLLNPEEGIYRADWANFREGPRDESHQWFSF
jgi:hypothetical protein